QDEVVNATTFFQTVDSGDIRVIQRGQHPRLALESPQPLRIPGKRLGQHFDRYLSSQFAVRRAVHNAHAARTQLLLDSVIPESLAYHKGSSRNPLKTVRQFYIQRIGAARRYHSRLEIVDAPPLPIAAAVTL